MSRRIIALLSALSLILSFSVLPVTADHNTTKDQEPELVNGNPSCASVYGPSDYVFEVKIEPVDDSPVGGDPYSFGSFSGTIILTVDEGAKTFDYSITGSAATVGVIVKGGPNANWYDYIGESAAGPTNIGPQTSDVDLHAPSRGNGFYGLSHISFCMVEAKASPSLVTSQTEVGTTNTGEDITVTIGASVTDTATLSGATTDAGGTIDFKVYGPADPTCSGTAVFTDLGNAVSGNGAYTSDPFTPSAVGTYTWLVTYSGDAKNNPASSACGVEVLTVSKNQPGLTTTPNVLPNDAATLTSLVSPSGGTITFKLYFNATCVGAPVDTWSSAVNANGTFSSANTTHFVTSDTVVSWVVEYSGDANNAAATSGCDAEQADVDFTPLAP